MKRILEIAMLCFAISASFAFVIGDYTKAFTSLLIGIAIRIFKNKLVEIWIKR